MSQVHHGMPAMPAFRPADSCLRMAVKVDSTSPDHSSAPYFCDPAQAQRIRWQMFSSPCSFMPS